MSAVKHPLYKTWESMRLRCSNPKATGYHHYGGRGITICDEWSDFWAFVADMGDRPKGHTLDRIDHEGPYSPENCRWATAKQQQRNRRNNHLIAFNGKALCVSAWAEELGLNKVTLLARLRRGWPVERALYHIT